MASVASQLIEGVTAHAQSDNLEDAREICADGTYFPNNLSNSASHKTSQIHYSNKKDNQILNRFWFTLSEYEQKKIMESHLSYVACMLTSDPQYTFLLIFLFRFDSINLFQTHFNDILFYGKYCEY